MNYTIELDKKRQHGCSLHRAFPYVVRDESGQVAQYAKTDDGARKWIERQKAVVKQ